MGKALVWWNEVDGGEDGVGHRYVGGEFGYGHLENPQWKAYWLLTLALPALLLRKRRGQNCADPDQRMPILRRIQDFMDGKMESLWKELVVFVDDEKKAAAAKCANAPVENESAERNEERCFRQTDKKWKLGDYTSAVNALRPAPCAPRNSETLGSLQTLNGEAEGEVYREDVWKKVAETLNAATPEEQEEFFSVEDFAKALTTAKAGKAQDLFGRRFEHLQSVIGTVTNRTVQCRHLHRQSMQILKGEIPKSIKRCLSGGRLAALLKTGAAEAGAKVLGVLHLLPIFPTSEISPKFRPFRHILP